MKCVEIYFPFYEKGDDLKLHLEQSGSVEEALERYAEDLEDAAAMVRQLKDEANGQDVRLFADKHVIAVEAADDLIERLEKHGLIIDCFDE